MIKLFSRNNSDLTWKRFAKRNPYWAVLSEKEFDKKDLDETERNAFFDTGREHVKWGLKLGEQHFGPLKRERALDFGCGVGRLVVPLADQFDHVTGVDISPDMMEIARSNCENAGHGNVDFVISSDELNDLEKPYDLIHSLIVLQHIPEKRGMKILSRLMDLTEPGGLLMVHIIIERNIPPLKNLIYHIRKNVPFANNLANLLLGKPIDEPMMQMNIYDMNKLMLKCFEKGFGQFYVHQHHDLWFPGVVLFAKKSPPVNPGDEDKPAA